MNTILVAIADFLLSQELLQTKICYEHNNTTSTHQQTTTQQQYNINTPTNNTATQQEHKINKREQQKVNLTK